MLACEAPPSPAGLLLTYPPDAGTSGGYWETPFNQIMTRAGVRRGRKAVSAMSLEFHDFARFYEGSGMSEVENEADFEAYACFMECIVRYFWQEDAVPNKLGISFNSDTVALLNALDSNPSLQNKFNSAADATREKG